MEVSERSHAVMTREHLERLADIALLFRDDLVTKRPDLAGRMIAACLAQGAARHFIHGRGGVKDIDIWLLFTPGGDRQVPYRTVYRRDFGRSELGRHPDDDPARFTGRRVDVLCRAVPPSSQIEPRQAVIAWLGTKCRSAKMLREKPVVLIWPSERTGEIVWNAPYP